MNIFGRKKRLEERVNAMSDVEFEQFMQEDYAKKEKRAKWTAIIAGAVTVATIGALGFTGLGVGLAAYKIAFGVGITAFIGGATVGSSMFLRRKFKVLKEIKEKLTNEINKGKSHKGRTFALGKQISKEHKRTKHLERMKKKGYLSTRQADAYEQINQAVANMAGRRGDIAATREAILAAIKGNREQLKFRIDGIREDFLNNELMNYVVNNARKGNIQVLMRAYDENGAVRLNTDGGEMFTPIVEISCNSDIDLVKSQEIVYNTLAKAEIELPVIVKSTVSGKGETPVYLNTKEELIDFNNKFGAKSKAFLDAHIVPEQTTIPDPRTFSSQETEHDSETLDLTGDSPSLASGEAANSSAQHSEEDLDYIIQ